MIDPNIPLLDLHRHLDGAVRLETILDLGREHRDVLRKQDLELPADDIEGLRPHIEVLDREPDLMTFLSRFRWLTAILVDLEACRRIGRENVEDAAREGIAYIELRFSPWFMAETHGLDPQGVVEAVADGVAQGVRETGVQAKIIGTLSRTYGPDIAHKELDALLACRDHLVAVDLAGDEAGFPPELFVEHFRRVRDAGLGVTIHAGEAGGAPGVWSALRDLGATRIGHCVHTDEALLDHLAENRIGVESNLTSNLQTSTVGTYAEHPLAKQLRRGILATINTDDPTISGIDLAYEYNVAAPKAGLDAELARQAQANALEIAFLSTEEKDQLKRGSD